MNLSDSLPYEQPEPAPAEEPEVNEEPDISDDIQTETDGDGQITLSLE